MRRLSAERAWIVVAALTLPSGPVIAQSSPAQAAAPVAGPATGASTTMPARSASSRSSAVASAREDAPAPPGDDLPVSLDRIREALERAPTPVITLPERPTFSVRVDGKLPTFEDYVQPGELQAFAMPRAMSHQEFLSMVTPPEYRPFASSINGELVQLVATSIAAKLAMSSVTTAIKQGWRHRKERQARDEVDAVLDALRDRDQAAARDTDQRPADPPR